MMYLQFRHPELKGKVQTTHHPRDTEGGGVLLNFSIWLFVHISILYLMQKMHKKACNCYVSLNLVLPMFEGEVYFQDISFSNVQFYVLKICMAEVISQMAKMAVLETVWVFLWSLLKTYYFIHMYGHLNKKDKMIGILQNIQIIILSNKKMVPVSPLLRINHPNKYFQIWTS